MCGSLGSGTLDHVFPKYDYPELSIFSRNLVPACLCNSKRKNDLTGPDPNERVLHPYFDDILEQRLLKAKITMQSAADVDTPVIDLVINLPETHAYHPAVKFHKDQIVCRTQVFAYFDKTWAKIVRSPQTYFDFPPGGDVMLPMFTDELIRVLQKKDTHFGTPNNWESMLFAGIVDSPNAKDYLLERINGLRAAGQFEENLYPH
jgi:hypothetical protein